MINFASNLNKMIDAGLGGPLDPPRTEVAVGHRVVYTEVSGDAVNFETNVIAPVKNLRVTMEPIQAGSGDPSPENIRPITGRDAVTVYRSGADMSDPQSVTVQLGQTVYGGTVDVTDGWCDDALMPVDLGSLTYTYISSSGGYFSASVSDIALENYAVAACSCYQTVTSGGISAIPDMSIRSYTSGQIIIRDSRFTAPADLKTALSGQTAMCKRFIANKIQVTPTEMTTLKGQNNVWSDAGNISLEYPYYEETEGY